MSDKTWIIIPCGAEKLDAPAPAEQLYSSSSFRMALAAAKAQAEEEGGEVLILSALHGLVQLDQVIAPYDVRMGDAGSVGPELIAAQARALGIVWEARPDVYAFLPRSYFAVLDEALRADDIFAAPVYEATRGIGDHRGVCRLAR